MKSVFGKFSLVQAAFMLCNEKKKVDRGWEKEKQ